MSRGRSLSQCVEGLQHECRLSTSTSRGIDNREFLKYVLRRAQELIYEENWWPFLRAEKASSKKEMAAGQRYYDFPTGINRDRIQQVWVEVGTGQWVPIDQGVGPDQYNAFNSDGDARADPVERWDYHGTAQFEAWPMPASDGADVWFEAMIPLPAFSVDADLAALDDHIIILRAAAEILAGNNQKDANAKLQQSQDRIRRLLGNSGSNKRVVLGGAMPPGHKTTALRVSYVRDA